jgi:putative oxidoreductase
MPYLGKGAEFVAGVLLLPGLFTRVACLITIGTFAYISFFVGHGKVWMDDQHPFLFVLFGLLFFFTGPGALSLDGMLFKNKRSSY